MKHRNVRSVFFGTPQLAVFVLEELEAAGIVPSLIVTAPDKPVGRKLTVTPPPVKVWGEERGIPVLQPASLKERTSVPELANDEWAVGIVAAYNIILPRWLLDLPRFGMLNVHPSLLPKLRGPSPIRSAILTDARDAVGVTVIKLDEQVDHGPILAQSKVELETWPVPGAMLDELLFREGGQLLAEVLPVYLRGDIPHEEQRHDEATFSKKFTKGDGELDLAAPGYENWLKYCAFDGWPGSYFFENGTRVKITDAEFVDEYFLIRAVIPEGKKEIPYEVWRAGHAATM